MAVLPSRLDKRRKYVGNNRGATNYWLEWLDKGATAGAEDTPGVMPLPSQPTAYTCVESYPTTIEHTLGLFPKREHNYLKRWDVTITGRIGVEPRPYLTKEPQDPIEILDDFRAFLRTYQEGATENGAVWLASTDQNRGETYFNYANVCLLLHATKENDHLYVELGAFEYDRNAASTRSSASWKLTLIGYAREDIISSPLGYYGFPRKLPSYNKVGKDALEAAAAVTREDEALFQARGMESTNRVLTSLRMERQRSASLAELKEWQRRGQAAAPGSGAAVMWCARLTQSFPWAAAGKLQQAQIASYAFLKQANDFRTCLRQGIALTAIPLTVLGNLRKAVDAYLLAVQEAWDAAGETKTAYLDVLLSAAEIAGMDGTAMFGNAGGKPGMFSTAEMPLSSPSGFSEVFVPGMQAAGTPLLLPPGVTSWAQAAAAFLGDSAYASALAKLNGAKDAYSDTNGKPLSPGDTVLVPVDGLSGAPTIEALMLVDLAVDPVTGDLLTDYLAHQVGSGTDLVSAAAAGTDLALQRGYANLVQAVRHRTITRRGSVPSLKGYGLLLTGIGDPMTEQLVSATVSGTRAQMLQDLRISEVEDLQVSEQDDTLLLEFRVVPVGSNEALTVVAPASAA